MERQMREEGEIDETENKSDAQIKIINKSKFAPCRFCPYKLH